MRRGVRVRLRVRVRGRELLLALGVAPLQLGAQARHLPLKHRAFLAQGRHGSHQLVLPLRVFQFLRLGNLRARRRFRLGFFERRIGRRHRFVLLFPLFPLPREKLLLLASRLTTRPLLLLVRREHVVQRLACRRLQRLALTLRPLALLVHLRVQHLHLAVQMFILALELEHATLQRHLLAVQVHHLLRELLAVVGLAAAARRERLGGFALAPLLRGARAPLVCVVADVGGEHGNERFILREHVQLHHLAAPFERGDVIVEVAQDVLAVLGVQLQRVVRRARRGHAHDLNLIARHDELVRRAEQARVGDEPRAVPVHVQRAQQVDAVAAGHDVRARPSAGLVVLGRLIAVQQELAASRGGGRHHDAGPPRPRDRARGRVGAPEAGLGLGRGRRRDKRRRGPGRGVAPRCRRRECRDASRGGVRHETTAVFVYSFSGVFSGRSQDVLKTQTAWPAGSAGNRRHCRVFSRDVLFREPSSGIHRKPRIEVSGVQSLPRLAPGGVRPAP